MEHDLGIGLVRPEARRAPGLGDDLVLLDSFGLPHGVAAEDGDSATQLPVNLGRVLVNAKCFFASRRASNTAWGVASK
jgi:hypothetical protein